MQFLLLYFSGTGNSALITSHIQKQLEQKGHQVQSISIEKLTQHPHLTFENKIIGFGFPVYKFSYPDIFNQHFPLFNTLAHHTPYFLYSTYARFPADCFADFAKNLSKKQFHLLATRAFKSPSNGISARLTPDQYEYQTVMFFEDHITQKINTFVEHLLQTLSQPNHKSPSIKNNWISPFRSKLVAQIEITKYPKLQIDSHQCTLCGLCAKNCPQQNLLKQTDQIHIIDDQNCLHCLRCMHHCPQNAINFGKLTRLPNRYTLKVRDRLFEKSTNGFQEPAWQNFQAITKQWRKNTIRYWYTHRHHPEI